MSKKEQKVHFLDFSPLKVSTETDDNKGSESSSLMMLGKKEDNTQRAGIEETNTQKAAAGEKEINTHGKVAKETGRPSTKPNISRITPTPCKTSFFPFTLSGCTLYSL